MPLFLLRNDKGITSRRPFEPEPRPLPPRASQQGKGGTPNSPAKASHKIGPKCLARGTEHVVLPGIVNVAADRQEDGGYFSVENGDV